MGALFYLVLNMGITASVIGLAIALARLALRGRLNATAQYALWALVGLCLVLPFTIPSKASLFNAVGKYVLRVASVPAGGTFVTMTNSIGAANAYFPLHFKTATLENIFNIAGAVWLAGALLAAVAAVALYTLTARRLRAAVPVMDGVLLAEYAALAGVKRKIRLYMSDMVASPVVFGVFRPRIVIPTAMVGDGETLRYALLHELTHIRRGDNILRLVSVLVLCIHWFNPFVWLFFALAGRDMELACDAGVLKRLDKPRRKEYALALAALASRRQPALAMAFGRSAVRQRIIGITKYRRLTIAAAIFTFVLLLALAAVLGTNPAG
jgi:beta-lactamase regulating signal transducer with metallopeptidase domain